MLRGLCVSPLYPLGTYRDLDLAIAFLDSAAFILFPPLLLHFSAIYPVSYHLFEGRRWRAAGLYVPAFVLLGFATAIFLHDELIKVVPHRLLDYSPNLVARFYKASFTQFVAVLVASTVLLVRRFVISKNTVARQQLKWVVWEPCWRRRPFTALYGLGYIFGETAGPLTDVAILPLVLDSAVTRLLGCSLPLDGR